MTNCKDLMDDGRITEILFTNLPKEDGWLLDGYPRTVQQAELLDRRLYESGNEVDLAIFLDVPKDSIRERIAGILLHSFMFTWRSVDSYSEWKNF
jgi:adenylate kinase